MSTVQCTGCRKTTTEEQLRDGLCGLCVYDRDKAKYSAENAELEAASRARQRRAHIATTISVLFVIAAIVGYIVVKKARYDARHSRQEHYREY
ncbi:MAG: hypothetical protein H0T46_05635 [Deltaproteobacteria bacterium]|nr:hypothetical protein [Deltaproteobacteria bacterium]